MSKDRRWPNLIVPLLWLLGWLLVMLFSHDYVSQKLNEKNWVQQQQVQQMELDYFWNFSDKSDVIESFRNDWQFAIDGLESNSNQPEISLEMAGRWIYPQIQQQLSWQLQVGSKNLRQAKVLLEFSDQVKDAFYYSPVLSLQDVMQTIDLKELKWHKQGREGMELSWEQLPAFNALVIRFYFPDQSKLTVQSITLKQTREMSLQNRVDCKQSMKCWNTNQQNALNQSNNQQQPLPTTEFVAIIDLSAWYWLAGALLLTVFGVWLANKHAELKVWLLVVGVFGFIALMSQSWMVALGQWLKWPVLVVGLLMFWLYRYDLIQFKPSALWLWLGSVLLTVLMLLGSDWQLSYLTQFPGYFIWALLQQLLIGPVASDVLYQHLHKNRATTAVLTGVLFSIVHAPNHTLMLTTLLGGVVWSYCWLKYRNLYANAFSHALLALTLYQVMPESWLGSARIGVFF